MNIRQTPLRNDYFSQWANKVTKTVNSHNVIAGNGLIVSQGSEGVILHVEDDINQQSMEWAGDYDFDAEYYPGQVVRVNTNTTYTDQNGITIPHGTNTASYSSGSGTLPIGEGTFVCVTYVPPSWCDEDHLQTQIAPNFAVIPDRYINGTRYYDYNTYYPIYNELPDSSAGSASIVIGAASCSIATNQTFWRRIAGVGGGPSSGVTYRGTYSSARTYQPGDIVRVQSGTSQGVWIQSASGSSTGIDPVFPEPATTGGTNTWDMFAFGVQSRIDCSNSSTSSVSYWNGTTPM